MGARERSSRDDGFTLMELVIVVIIIGILATIAIAVFLTQREKAERSSAISSARNTLTLAESIRFDDPVFPGDPNVYTEEGGSGFTFTDGPSTGPTVVSIATFWNGTEEPEGPVLVATARGGGRCFWVRRAVGEDPARGFVGADGDPCDASDTGLLTAPDTGW